MDISDLKIGIENSYTPPFENNLRMTKTYEKDGFDSLWFSDHIMSWIPDAIWTPDITSLASYLRSPHDSYNVFPVMAVIASNTKRVNIGTAVTEIFRHPPSLLAHMIITLDHISKGRMILGIGAGEAENLIPYGIEWEKPFSRLEEAIKIIKLLWRKSKKVDYDGKFWKLKDAVLSLRPIKKRRAPPIWIGAHGPKMLEMTAKLGDGWLPFALNPKRYKECLEIIHTSAKKEGRNIDEITPAIELSLIIDEKQEECEKLVKSPIVKNWMLALDDKIYKEYSISHPFGDNFKGVTDYIPNRYDKKALLEAYDKIPIKMCKDFYLAGTPEDIIEKIEEYAKIGAKHIIILNYTIMCDIQKFQSSYNCIKKVLDYFKEEKLKVVDAFPT